MVEVKCSEHVAALCRNLSLTSFDRGSCWTTGFLDCSPVILPNSVIVTVTTLFSNSVGDVEQVKIRECRSSERKCLVR
jgi:hypothetical protein